MIRQNTKEDSNVIVLEFNELCPAFMEKFIGDGILPNFKNLRDSSLAMVTDADEEAPRLEPWIQWVSIHSGMKAEQHRIFDLGEGRKLREKCIAKILSDHGISVGVLGSMNTNYRNLNGFFVPDPWDLDGKAEPAELQPFYSTVSRQIQDSSTNKGLTRSEMANFGWFMLRHGMRSATVAAGLRQIAAERRDSGVHWRRSMILEQLQYDLFRYLKRQFKPRFSTFFANSTAHFQHYYWRNMEPEIFEIPPGEEDHPSLRTAIREGYQRMDDIVGRFRKDFPDSRLVLLTALSQKPWRETTKCTFRPRDFRAFLEFAGIDPETVVVKPVMAEEFHLICKDSESREDIARKLIQTTVDGKPAMKARIEDDGLFCGCTVTDYRAREGDVTHPTGGTRKFDDMFHMVHSMRSGRHHPHGLFWVQSENPRIVAEPVPLVDVAPTLLNLFGIAPPNYMSGQPISIDTPVLAGAGTN